jgi:hypothetical protein
VKAIRGAAAGLRIPAQRSPWLAPLPDALLLRDLPAPDGGRARGTRPSRSASSIFPPSSGSSPR